MSFAALDSDGPPVAASDARTRLGQSIADLGGGLGGKMIAQKLNQFIGDESRAGRLFLWSRLCDLSDLAAPAGALQKINSVWLQVLKAIAFGLNDEGRYV